MEFASKQVHCAVESKKFTGKCILFGEHLVLRGESALIVPLPAFKGEWKLGNKQNQHMKSLYRWADWLERQEDLAYWWDASAFRASLDEGYRFVSDIPAGYGAGSSGALVAAVAHHFQKPALQKMPLGALQGFLARMESFFHGTSSGIDPLVSFTGQPILVQPHSAPSPVEMKPLQGLSVFLIDTRQPRLSNQLIRGVQDKNEEESTRNALQEYLIPASHKAIHAALSGDSETVYEAVDTISRIQFEHWGFLFSDHCKRWVEGSFSDDRYRLKICGTGGGGFLLGFAPVMKDVFKALPQAKIIAAL